MCNYITHVRLCPVCKSKETILISESVCVDARPSGVFGSCGATGNKTSETLRKCWGCKEFVGKAFF